MKTLTLGLALTLLASAAPAQQMLSTASPIPDGAELRGSAIMTAWPIRRMHSSC